MENSRVRIQLGFADRWYIFHPTENDFAWSGSRWVMTIDGVPSGGIAVCNFSTLQDAENYVRDLETIEFGMMDRPK